MTDALMRPRSASEITSYHIHVFFEEKDMAQARMLRDWIAERFLVDLGAYNAQPIGPHTTPSFFFGFKVDQLPTILPWIQLNNLGFRMLLHPNTDNPRADHTDLAFWLNGAQPVLLEILPLSLQAGGFPPDYAEPNTTPNVKPE